MNIVEKTNGKMPIIREYSIDNRQYIVTATVKDGMQEDAATKIRRMIRNEINTRNKKINV